MAESHPQPEAILKQVVSVGSQVKTLSARVAFLTTEIAALKKSDAVLKQIVMDVAALKKLAVAVGKGKAG